jgi:hypothetical protein
VAGSKDRHSAISSLISLDTIDTRSSSLQLRPSGQYHHCPLSHTTLLDNVHLPIETLSTFLFSPHSYRSATEAHDDFCNPSPYLPPTAASSCGNAYTPTAGELPYFLLVDIDPAQYLLACGPLVRFYDFFDRVASVKPRAGSGAVRDETHDGSFAQALAIRPENSGRGSR